MKALQINRIQGGMFNLGNCYDGLEDNLKATEYYLRAIGSGFHYALAYTKVAAYMKRKVIMIMLSSII